jgi:hypothetical protein
MGFGIMFIGCCFMLLGAFTTFAPFTYVLGSAIIMYSLKELIRQNKMFFITLVITVVEFLASMTYMFIYVLSSNQALISAMSLALSISNVVFCALALTSIYLLAKQVELPSIQAKVVITYILMAIYVICVILLNAFFKDSDFAMSRLSLIIFISQILYSIMVLVTVANSYIRICYEDDKDMDKKTGNAPLDFLNDKLNYAMTPKEKRDLKKDENDKGDKKQ